MVVSLSMGWRHLAFQNYPVRPAVVDAHLPDAFDLDKHDGAAWLSIVPFTNVAVRPTGLPARAGICLPELNLRTYVTYEGVPGVYFFSLDAHGITSVTGARLFHHLPYYYARISLETTADGVVFSSCRLHPGARPVHYEARYRADGEPFAAPDDPLVEFLLERYRLYTQAPDGTVRYTAVDHDPWTVYPATIDVEQNTLLESNGFAEPEADPVCYYSPGLDVVASPSNRI